MEPFLPVESHFGIQLRGLLLMNSFNRSFIVSLPAITTHLFTEKQNRYFRENANRVVPSCLCVRRPEGTKS